MVFLEHFQMASAGLEEVFLFYLVVNGKILECEDRGLCSVQSSFPQTFNIRILVFFLSWIYLLMKLRENQSIIYANLCLQILLSTTYTSLGLPKDPLMKMKM